MAISVNNLFQRLHMDKYLNAHVIFLLDIAASLLASLLALCSLWLLFRNTVVYPLTFLLEWFVAGVAGIGFFFWLLKTYLSVIRHSNLREIGNLTISAFGKEIVLTAIVFLFPLYTLPLSYLWSLIVLDGLFTMTVLILMRVLMIVGYDAIRSRLQRKGNYETVLIYGTDNKAISFVRTMQLSDKYSVAGFILYGETSKNLVIIERKVYSFQTEADFQAIASSRRIDSIIFAHREDARQEENRLIRYCRKAGVRVLFSPSVEEVIDGKVQKNSIREIKIEDLLGRPEIKISLDEIINNFKDKTIMVTGAAGSIGSELCRQLATFGIKRLVMYDNAETPMHNIRLEMEERFPQLDFVPVIGDVRHTPRLDFVFRTHHPQVVFHAAAYKHVPLMEENPCEAVLVNVAGSRNVADKCIEYGVEKMVMISTDKAVNPTNIMGCTKRLAEIYVQSLGLALESCPESLGIKSGQPVTKFVTTRFGNVLGSNGSVIPRFRDQIAQGGPVTVTHRDITRFFMTIPEACRLVMEAATMSTGNQIFVFDMGASVKIAHLAKRMIELAGFIPGKDIKIAYTGLRPGEKLYEEVLSNAENTLPTDHDRIRIAKVREYNYQDALKASEELERLSRAVEIPEMVKLMKQIVPEFKSKNSEFEKYDIEVSQESQQ